MSSRRSFLGAAAAALTLPTAAAEADPTASNPGREGADPYSSAPPSTSTAARVSARATVGSDDGAVSVRSVRFVREDGPHPEAEVELDAGVLSVCLTLDGQATRQLRDTLAGDRREGHVGGRADVFSWGMGEDAEASIAVLGDRLQVEASDVEAAVVLEEELRDDVVGGLEDALAEPATVE